MNFELKTLTTALAAKEKCDALIVLVCTGFKAGTAEIDQTIAAAIKSQDFDTKAGKSLHIYRPEGVAARRLVLVGAGDGDPKGVRQAVSSAMGLLKGTTAKQVCLLVPSQQGAVRSAVVSAADGTYVYGTTKSKPESRKLTQVTIGVDQAAPLQAEFTIACAAVSGIELAKEWANRPANHATPTHLAQVAKGMAKAARTQCEVLGPKEINKLKMGSFLAVAQGSRQEPRFIVLRYNGASRDQAPVVLVGKGITFDTGGISIKPAPEMDEMKFDMCGATSVLGVFKALTELQPAINVVGLIPSCENMPDGQAVKPGDVVTSMSGQTIEILNTDAEGRLILCDALTYAERFKPRAVVDVATLTGACVIALGAVRSGLFSTDDGLAQALLVAGEKAGDLCWRMPLDDEYAEGLKSNFADVGNVGGRAGGAVTAAKFLQRFADKFPWAHLDIAGTAWKSGAAKGATGRPVGLLLDYVLSQVPAESAAKRPARKAKSAA